MAFKVSRDILAAVAVAVAVICSSPSVAQSVTAPPRLVVNIVVGSMRATDLDRYKDNFSIGGFNRLRIEGVECSSAQFSYQSGTTLTSLATISSGTLPSTHGVIGRSWYDRVSNEYLQLTFDNTTKGVAFDIESGGDSPKNLVAQTLTEALRAQSPESRTLTVALDAESALVLNGRGGDTFWFDPYSCEWATSTAYMESLPDWLTKLNRDRVDPEVWSISSDKVYKNSREYGVLTGLNPITPQGLSKKASDSARRYEYIAYTPAGNSMTLDMAWRAVESLDLGKDEVTDILNISLDCSANIVSRYGAESMEAEDMYYKLDRDLSKFIDRVRDWVEFRDVMFVITAAGGSSPSTDLTEEDRRFNTEQFAVILNTFLGAKYGAAQWILGYENRSIYLNHQQIYREKLSVEQLQNEVAEFALQFRGVSHAVTASAMRNSYFADGFGAMIQRSFYPRRSGDVVINLMPEWIEDRDGVRSQYSSMHHYDRDVPLLIMGSGIDNVEVRRGVNMIDIAPTIASLIHINKPTAAEGEVIEEIVAATQAAKGVKY